MSQPEPNGKDVPYLSLQPSEMAIFHGASRIYAAMVGRGEVHDDNRRECFHRAVHDAILLAQLVDRNVESDDELKGKLAHPSFPTET